MLFVHMRTTTYIQVTSTATSPRCCCGAFLSDRHRHTVQGVTSAGQQVVRYICWPGHIFHSSTASQRYNEVHDEIARWPRCLVLLNYTKPVRLKIRPCVTDCDDVPPDVMSPALHVTHVCCSRLGRNTPC